MFSSAVIVTTFLIVSVSGIPTQKATKDNHGNVTTIEEHPYMVSVLSQGHYMCSGSIISRNFVLAPARYLVQSSESSLSIRAGSAHPDVGGKIHKVKLFVTHSHFGHWCCDNPEYDIALIRVLEPFKFDKTVRPIPLFQAYESIEADETALTTGWGDTEHGSPTESLRVVKVSIVDRYDCYEAHWDHHIILVGQVCGRSHEDGYNGTCLGDSSDPLVVKGRLAGIMSWHHGCGDPKHPDIYTEVAHHYDWIRDKVREHRHGGIMWPESDEFFNEEGRNEKPLIAH